MSGSRSVSHEIRASLPVVGFGVSVGVTTLPRHAGTGGTRRRTGVRVGVAGRAAFQPDAVCPTVSDAAACCDSGAHHDPAARNGDRSAAPRAPTANRGGDRDARCAQRRKGRVRRRPGLTTQTLRRLRCPPLREQGPHGRGTRLSARRLHPRPVLLRRPLLPRGRHLSRTQTGAAAPPAHPDRRQQPGLLRARGSTRIPDSRRDPHQPTAEATRASRDLPQRAGRGRTPGRDARRPDDSHTVLRRRLRRASPPGRGAGRRTVRARGIVPADVLGRETGPPLPRERA